MAVDLDSVFQEGDEDEGAVPMAEEDAPSHHPDAPPDEVTPQGHFASPVNLLVLAAS